MGELIISVYGSSDFGSDHEVEQAVIDLFAKNRLLPTREGKVIDFSAFEVSVKKPSNKDVDVKNETEHIKRTTGNNQ